MQMLGSFRWEGIPRSKSLRIAFTNNQVFIEQLDVGQHAEIKHQCGGVISLQARRA